MSDALQTIDKQLRQSQLHISNAFTEVQQRWFALTEHYEGQGAEEAGMVFQTLARWNTEHLELLQQLQTRIAEQDDALKSDGL